MEGPDVLWMRQPAPEFGATFPHSSLAPVLGLDETALDSRFPVQEVSTGLPFVMVPLQDLAALKQVKVDRDRCLTLLADAQAKALLVFSPETYERRNDLSARVFADYYGIPEDPATGSANGCLAAYLTRHRYFGSDRVDVSVEQGYAIDRPSLLYLRASDEADGIAVSVGGGVKMVAHGSFL